MRPLLPASAEPAARAVAIPDYLSRVYSWAYIHPRAIRCFEREWLVNLILFGHYRRLRDSALAALGTPLRGRTLQVACVYGSLSERIRSQLADDGRLDVVDVVPGQLRNLARKLPADPRVTLVPGDSAALPFTDAAYDRVLLFFLLHEQPEEVRRATLAEALRVVRPGGQVVIVDYHRPRAWHPLRPLVHLVFRTLEPYAMDLWRHPLVHFLPEGGGLRVLRQASLFGGLYQSLVLERIAS